MKTESTYFDVNEMLEELSLTKEIRVAYESVRDLKEKRDKKPKHVLQNRRIPWLCP